VWPQGLAVWADGSLALTGDGFVATFGPSGDYRWTRLVDVRLIDAYVDASDTLTAIALQTDSGGVPILHFDAEGSLLGQSLFPTPFMVNLIGPMVVDARGDVLGIPNAGSALAAVEQAPTGQVLWSRPLSATGGVSALAAFGGTPTPVLAGAFQGTLDLVTGPLTSLPGPNGAAAGNVFVAVLPP
jgi:hypothetical protein